MHVGFSISATAAIIGVSFLMILEISMGTLFPMFTDIDESYDNMRQRAIDELQTDIEIENISVQANSSLHDLTINLKNKGATTIEVSSVDLLVNGSLFPFSCNEEYWFPESNYTISVYGLSGSGLQQVKLIVFNGISDYGTYSV